MIKELYEIVRGYFKSEIQKIKALEKGKRGGYIWDYHKWKIIIASAVILAAAGLIVQAATHKDTVFNLALVNQTVDLDADADKAERLVEILGADERHEKINVDSSYQVVWTEGEDNDYTDYEKFFLNVSNGAVDCAVVPEVFADYCFSLEEFAIPTNELNISVPEERQYIYNGTPYGVYVDGTEFADETKDGRCVAFFPNTGRNGENAEKFAKYLVGVINDAS